MFLHSTNSKFVVDFNYSHSFDPELFNLKGWEYSIKCPLNISLLSLQKKSVFIAFVVNTTQEIRLKLF